jgi:proton-translocating NAD(P)+ transhydrogenase
MTIIVVPPGQLVQHANTTLVGRLRGFQIRVQPSVSSQKRSNEQHTIQTRPSPNWVTITKRPASNVSQPTLLPYSSLTVGIPCETYPNELRVAITPQNVTLLLKKGFSRVLVERGAGDAAQFPEEAYTRAGATLVDRDTVWSKSNILLKVRAPIVDTLKNEVQTLRRGSVIISFLYPAQNRHIVDAYASRGITSFAMDMIPRISRAQVFDALRCAEQRPRRNVFV